MGIPSSMFTVIFAMARTVGWIAHWSEMHSDGMKIARPRQLYTGYAQRDLSRILRSKNDTDKTLRGHAGFLILHQQQRYCRNIGNDQQK